MTTQLRLWLLSVSVLLAVIVCVWTGLIPDWGRWYSPSLPYRLQTEAMLRGSLVLSSSPADAQFDLVWGKDGVQHVWGLGVPCWRFAFEWLAWLFGQPAFPDRLAFAIALGLLNYLLLRTFTVSSTTTDMSSWLRQPPEKLAAVFLMALFPPMLVFFHCPFNVYEEASAYGYIYGVGLFACLIAFSSQVTLRRYLTICVLSGLAGFIRPTILGYGLVTFIISFCLSRLAGWSWRKSLIGLICFSGGGILLLFTNLMRFGSPWEFGYGLQMNLMYELRFTGPFKHEPLLSAARELFGSIFFTKELNNLDFLRSGIVSWQSDTPRWRNFYHTTFDVTYLIVLATYYYIIFRQLLKLKSWFHIALITNQQIAAFWSVLSVALLSAFYLRCPAMSSRYVLDFAPAIGVAFAGLLWGLASMRIKYGKCCVFYLLSILCVWWLYEIATSTTSFKGKPKVLSLNEVEGILYFKPSFEQLPKIYYAEDNPNTYGIPQNRQGWRNSTGETGPLVILFVDSPQRICLKLSGYSNTPVAPEEYMQIQVKVGLESLNLESMTPLGETRLLFFSAPRTESYRKGIQVLFIGLAQSNNFAQSESKFRLLSVSWRN